MLLASGTQLLCETRGMAWKWQWVTSTVEAVFDGCRNIHKVRNALDRGFPLTATDQKHGNTLLHFVALYSSVHALVPRMLAAGWDPNARNRGGYTPVHWACASGKVHIVQALVAAGGRLDAEGNDGQTPLFSAGALNMGTASENCALFEWLGACPEVDFCHKTIYGRTVLDKAAHSRHRAVLLRLMAAHARWTPLRAVFVGAAAVAAGISSG